MKPDNKKTVSMIVGLAKGPNHLDNLKPAESKDGVEQDSSMPAEAAAEDLLAAIASNSPKAVVEAMKALMEVCGDADYEEAE